MIDGMFILVSDVKESQALHEIIYMVLIVGNFMNDVSGYLELSRFFG